MLALLAAGAGGLMLTRTRQLMGVGTLLGSTAAAVWGLGFLTADLTARDDLGAGFWAELLAHLLLLLTAGLAAAVLGSTRVRLASRPAGPLAWLTVVLGLAGTVMLLIHIRILSDAGFVWSGEYDSLLPWACLAVITPVLPALAVLVSPRWFAIAIIAGWIGGAFAVVVYGYLYYLSGNYDQPGPLIAFGGTLPALLVTSIRNANSATHR